MIHAAIQTLGASERLDRHRHADAYAALVLAGSYEEAGENGRCLAVAGMLIVHGRHGAHLNRVGCRGARVINLPIDPDTLPAVRQVGDVDRIARLAETDACAAGALALRLSTPLKWRCNDWPDLLAADLMADPDCHLAAWASHHRLSPGSLSRGFAKAFGVTPKRFRYELKALGAARRLARGHEPLAALALDCGFADQAHFTRAVRSVTGASPRRLRRSG